MQGTTSIVEDVQANSPGRLLTVEEVASWFQCSPQAVYNWAEMGVLAHIKIGRLVRFRQQDIAAFIETNRRTQRVL